MVPHLRKFVISFFSAALKRTVFDVVFFLAVDEAGFFFAVEVVFFFFAVEEDVFFFAEDEDVFLLEADDEAFVISSAVFPAEFLVISSSITVTFSVIQTKAVSPE